MAYLIPTIAFLICPLILYYGRKRYVRSRPEGSVLSVFCKLYVRACEYEKMERGRTSKNVGLSWWDLLKNVKTSRDGEFWERVKPSRMRQRGEEVPIWMEFDDREFLSSGMSQSHWETEGVRWC
jgi:proton-dependent oligopeptide transporter, POT family